MAGNKRSVRKNSGGKKKGFFYRMTVGKERTEDYAHSTLPTNRWALFFDVMKGNLGKMCLINLLMLLGFAAPFVLAYLGVLQESYVGAQLPFMNNFGIGFPLVVDVDLQAYLLSFNLNLKYLFLVCISTIALVPLALSGGFYIIRNMVWTEGTFVASDFLRGIKKNYFKCLLITIFWTIFFFIARYNSLILNYRAVTEGASALFTLYKVMTYLLFGLVTIMCFYMVTMTVTYELSFFALLKNSFLLSVGLLPQNVFFLGIALLPVILVMTLYTSAIFMILLFVIILIAFSFMALVWTTFNHWVFDKYLNDKTPGAVKNRGIYKSDVKEENIADERKFAALAQYYSQPHRAIKPVTDTEVNLTELPLMFSRNDLQRLKDEKQVIANDAEEYAKLHENDYLDRLKKLEEKQNNKKQTPSYKNRRSKPNSQASRSVEVEDDNLEMFELDDNFDNADEAMLLEGYEPNKKNK